MKPEDSEELIMSVIRGEGVKGTGVPVDGPVLLVSVPGGTMGEGVLMEF